MSTEQCPSSIKAIQCKHFISMSTKKQVHTFSIWKKGCRIGTSWPNASVFGKLNSLKATIFTLSHLSIINCFSVGHSIVCFPGQKHLRLGINSRLRETSCGNTNLVTVSNPSRLGCFISVGFYFTLQGTQIIVIPMRLLLPITFRVMFLLDTMP